MQEVAGLVLVLELELELELVLTALWMHKLESLQPRQRLPCSRMEEVAVAVGLGVVPEAVLAEEVAQQP